MESCHVFIFCEVVHERERNTRLIFLYTQSSLWLTVRKAFGHAKSWTTKMELLIDAFESFRVVLAIVIV